MRAFLAPRRLPVAVLVVGLAGCGGAQPAPAPEPVLAPEPEPVTAAPDPRVRVDTVVLRDAAMEQRLNRLELQLLERDAQIEQLEARLDEAWREVARTMAKLRTVATRAEAASAMAEAEIAVQALPASAATRGVHEAPQARRLLEQSGREFNQQNYGGALYLATQAKNMARQARARLAEPPRGGPRNEVPFAAPVRLEAVGRTNVRAGPGLEASVLFVVERGAAVQAHAYAGDWVRVTDPEGRSGWMLRARLARPDEADGTR